MAKKTAKSTREQVYREILERSGIRFEDCNVLGFAFKQEWRPGTRTTGDKKPHPANRARRSKYRVGDTW